MEEKQITVGHQTHILPDLYMVIATQNPIEQEGTYNLPEAQMDRFLMHIEVSYPSNAEELEMVDLIESPIKKEKTKIKTTSQKEIIEARKLCKEIFISDELKKYAISLVDATRFPGKYDKQLAQWLALGGSPRATLSIIKCAKSLAWLQEDECVTPSHIKKVFYNIIRHRISLSFEAEADMITKNQVIEKVLEVVAVP